MRISLSPESVKLVNSVGGANASLSIADNASGNKSLRLDYQFEGNGYTSIVIPVSIDLPANYELLFNLAGTGQSDLQIKLVSQPATPEGAAQTVWWVSQPEFNFKASGQNIKKKKRHFTFAWGANNEPLTHVDSIEFTLVGGVGRKGYILLAGLDFEEIPLDGEYTGTPVITASSGQPTANRIIDSDPEKGWVSNRREQQKLTIDFGCNREFGGIVIDWGAFAYAADYDVKVRAEGDKNWKIVDRVRGGRALRQYHFLPETEARMVRILMRGTACKNGYEMLSCRFEPLNFGASLNGLLSRVARDSRPGFYPRAYLPQPEQSFWTVVGVSGAAEKGLINEEGVVEICRGGPTIEPFIIDATKGKFLSWNDGKHTQALADGYLPIPSVVREHETLKLTVEACAHGKADSSTLYVSYTLENTGTRSESGSLALTLRHLQVLPPWQFLSTTGGFSPLHKLRFDLNDGTLHLDNGRKIIPERRPGRMAVSCLASRDIIDYLHSNDLPHKTEIEDPHGFASAACVYRYLLSPGDSLTVSLAVPLHADSEIVSANDARLAASSEWRQKLGSTQIKLAAAPELVETIKSQLAYILITREGAMIQPGSRSYRRVWIRDAAMMSVALLQHGFVEEVREFIEWFAPFQFPQGKIPCCVDERGAAAVPENDAMGEFIYLIAEYYRYAGDRSLVERLFPQVLKAAEYIDTLREQERSQENERPDRKRFFGLMPPSISHEGYSDKAAYSFFDDAWTYTGLRDAVFLAAVIGDEQSEKRLTASRDEFLHDLLSAIKLTMEFYNFDYIAGAADRGDVDPTSTTIFLDPAWLKGELGRELESTMAKGWEFFQDRLNGKSASDGWTPYEWRIVESYIRLGQPEKAHASMDYFMAARRPAAWNHWAEVVFLDPLKPGFIGDAPHCWVGSDFLRSARSLFAYETQDGLTVFAGLEDEWLDAGVQIRNLPTHYGWCSLQALRVFDSIMYAVEGELTKPLFLCVPPGCSRATNEMQKPLSIDPETNTVKVDSPRAVVYFQR